MRYLVCLILCFLGVRAFCQSPFLADSILWRTKVRKPTKPIPFDKPFVIVLDTIDASRVRDVYVYQTTYKNGVSNLSMGTVVRPDMHLPFDTSGNKLAIFFRAIKPNKDFDINIWQTVSEKNLQLFYTVFKDLDAPVGNAPTLADLGVLLRAFTQKHLGVPTQSAFFYDLATFKSMVYDNVPNDLAGAAGNAGLARCNSIRTVDIQTIYGIAQVAKIDVCKSFSALSEYVPGIINDLSYGAYSASPDPDQKPAGPYDFRKRTSNLKQQTLALDSIASFLRRLSLASTDPLIQQVLGQVVANQQILEENFKKLSTHVDNMDKVINQYSYESTWLIGTTQATDLKSKAASLISTELGVANIIVSGNDGNAKYIPKVYLGLDIFFRQVNRDLVQRYLPPRRHRNDQYYKDTASHLDDHLSATRTILQHLSLSIGVTFGTMNEKYFDNLFSGMSLLIGPSYRFARAFRFSPGVALLKRSNPNPLLSTEKVTAGFYLSFSVDFDFFATAKNFTDLITK